MVAADEITKREESDSGEREGLVAIKNKKYKLRYYYKATSFF